MALTTPAVIKPEKHRVNVVIRIFCKSIIPCILKLINYIFNSKNNLNLYYVFIIISETSDKFYQIIYFLNYFFLNYL